MSAKDTAVKILDEARVAIQGNMALHYRNTEGKERWINASGRSSAAFQVVADNDRVQLVYRGDDVAPMETIQYGYKGEADINDIAEWKAIKESQGATEIPSPENVVKRIRKEGTERYRENEAGKPQDWVISPVVSMAVQALNEQLPDAMVKDITELLQQELR